MCLGPRRDNICVSGKHKQRPLGATTKPQVPDLAKRHEFRVEAMRLQLIDDEILTAFIVWGD